MKIVNVERCDNDKDEYFIDAIYLWIFKKRYFYQYGLIYKMNGTRIEKYGSYGSLTKLYRKYLQYEKDESRNAGRKDMKAYIKSKCGGSNACE